jgi:hypothetical protein
MTSIDPYQDDLEMTSTGKLQRDMSAPEMKLHLGL